MPDKRYTKVEEEVIQILDRLEQEAPAKSRPNLRLVTPPTSRRQRRTRLELRSPRIRTLPTWTWIAAAFVLAFAAVLLNDASQQLALVVAIASVVAFFAPLVLNRSPRGSGPAGSEPGVKAWRGRDISFGPHSGESTADRARRWLDNRRGRPPRS